MSSLPRKRGGLGCGVRSLHAYLLLVSEATSIPWSSGSVVHMFECVNVGRLNPNRTANLEHYLVIRNSLI